MPVGVLTQHNDNGRSGANLQETILKTSNVNVNQFGLVATHAVTGEIYAQPLYAPGVTVNGIKRDLVVVATMDNWVYAFDANDVSPGVGPVWKRQVDPHPVPSTLYGLDYLDIYQKNIGILGTPVIDGVEETLYFVAATYD